MSFYGNLQSKASQLLAKFGQDVAVLRSTPADYDPSTSQQASTEARSVFKGAMFDFGAGVTQMRGETVEMSDKRLLLEGAALPNIKDRIQVGLVTYAILSIGEINPAGTSVLFDLHLRR